MTRIVVFVLFNLNILATAQGANFRFSVVNEMDTECAQILSNRPSLKAQVLAQGSSSSNSNLSRNEFLFAPNFEVVAKVPPVVTVEQMQEERSMFSATPEFAIENGGPIVRQILQQIPAWYYDKAKELGLYPNIDVRVHDLSLNNIPEGFDLYPAIPGWHADGEFRETYFAQPDLNKVPVSFHIISTVSTDPQGVSNTQFILNPIKMTVDEILPDSALWQNVHRYVEGMPNKKYADMQDGNITLFDARSLHRAMPTKRSGWRFFFRMSMWHKPNLGEGQLGKQEQLYLLPKPETKMNHVAPTNNYPAPKVIGSFKATEPIEVLAEEQSLVGASLDYIEKNGGPISKRLIKQLPPEVLQRASEKGQKPIIDLMIYRLYPMYRPFFPDYNGNPKSAEWHTPTNTLATTEEYWMSVSSHEQGVNLTEFAGAILKDGELLQTTSQTPRRELPATNRGWRLMMRVRFTTATEAVQSEIPLRIMTQQYVDPGSDDLGW